jgi:hypothetical protein
MSRRVRRLLHCSNRLERALRKEAILKCANEFAPSAQADVQGGVGVSVSARDA